MPSDRHTTGSSDGITQLSAGTADSPAGQPLAPGHRFQGYTIVRFLGRGGMGEVYEVEEGQSGRRLALKVLSQSIANPESAERFLREGRLAASVSHPNSVYVFGTSDVGGKAAIAMELVSGGTLEDEVAQKGPMSPTQAVDAALQVVAGLEAAAARGVLHRDVKPSNCFIDARGNVKIGDYGLSLSTGADDQTRLTMMGMFLGTPAYASPEQIRGAALDIRADMYSVSATLYFLLTGRAPFKASGGMQTLASVLQDVPESPRKHVRTVPEGLAQVVLRALRKDPAARYGSYADFRKALLPFSSTSAAPASLRMRLAAFLIDFCFWIPFVAIDIALPVSPIINAVQLSVAVLIQTMYFATLESRWGASIGKRALGLRVTSAEGGSPTWRQAALRALVLLGLLNLSDATEIFLLLNLSATEIALGPSSSSVAVGMFMLAGSLLVIFWSSGRRPDKRAVHELVSGTRTVAPPALTAIRGATNVRQADELGMTPFDAPTRFGPYRGQGRMRVHGHDTLDLARDENLDRSVWIHHRPTNAPPLSIARQNLARETRLRWLQSSESDEGAGAWEAYEAPAGGPLTQDSWDSIRQWLLQLAREIAAGASDGTLPASIGTHHVWISGGAAWLADFSVPGAAPGKLHDVRTPKGAQEFLHAVATSSLGGAQSSQGLPVSARLFLDRLQAGAFASHEEILTGTAELTRRKLAISRWHRGLSIGFAALVPFLALLFALARVPADFRLQNDSVVDEAYRMLRRLAALDSATTAYTLASEIAGQMGRQPAAFLPQEIDAFRVFVGDRYGSTLAEDRTWQLIRDTTSAMEAGQLRDLADRARDHAASVSPEVRTSAAADARRIIARVERSASQRRPFVIEQFLFISGWMMVCWFITSVCSILLAFSFKGGAILRLFGYEIVNARGHRVSRLHAASRALIAWSPVLAGFAVSMMIGGTTAPWLPAAAVGLLLAGAMVAILNPSRGIQDLAARSRIVPH